MAETGSGTIAITGSTTYYSISYEKAVSEIYKDIYKGKKFTSLQEELNGTTTTTSYSDLFFQGNN